MALGNQLAVPGAAVLLAQGYELTARRHPRGQVIALYDQLVRLDPSPIVRLNRAIAIAELDGPEVALAEVDGLPLKDYHAFHATHADLLRRLGRSEESRAAYDRAIELPATPQRRLTSSVAATRLPAREPHHSGHCFSCGLRPNRLNPHRPDA